MEMDIDDYFAKTLTKLRMQHRYTQQHLAEEAGLDRTYISMLERGRRKPSLEVVFKIANGLKIDVMDVVGDVKYQVEEHVLNEKNTKCPH